MLGDGVARDWLQEGQGHLEWTLVDRGAHAALQDHLKDLGIGRLLVCGVLELVDLLLEVFNCNFDWSQNELLLVDDRDARLDVRKRAFSGQDCLAFVLLIELAVSLALQREWR